MSLNITRQEDAKRTDAMLVVCTIPLSVCNAAKAITYLKVLVFNVQNFVCNVLQQLAHFANPTQS